MTTLLGRTGQERISSALVTDKRTPPITEGKCSHFGNGPDHSVKTEIVAKTLALCTPMPNRIRRQSYGRARKSGFITCPGKGEKQEASASRTVRPILVSREGYIVRREIVIKIKTVPVALVVRNLPANAGDLRDVGSIPRLERSSGEGMATHSSILAWKIAWTEEPSRL